MQFVPLGFWYAVGLLVLPVLLLQSGWQLALDTVNLLRNCQFCRLQSSFRYYTILLHKSK